MTPKTEPSREEVTRRETRLVAQYGELLSLSDLATVLRYPTTGAIQQARRRGALPVATHQIRGRQGWFATAHAVAVYLAKLDAPQESGSPP